MWATSLRLVMKTLVRSLAVGVLALALAWSGLSPVGGRPVGWLAPQASVAYAAGKQTVKLNPTGGTVSRKSIKVSAGASFGKLPSPSRPFYAFAGWYTKKSGGTKVTLATKVAKGVKTLYAHWTATNVAKMKRGVTYSVPFDGSKKHKVKFTDKRKGYDCTRTLWVDSKKAHSGNCTDGWYDYTLVKVNSKLTLVYAVYYHEIDHPGSVYRYDGKKLKLIRDLDASDPDYAYPEEYGGIRVVSAGNNEFTLRLDIDQAGDFDDNFYRWDVTYRYAGGKLSAVRSVTSDPYSRGRANSAAAQYARYCPGAVPGNTTDVSIQSFTHPSWGAATFVVCRPHVTARDPWIGYPNGTAAHVVVVDAKGHVRWNAPDLDGLSSYAWELAVPATDSSGNLFVHYDPGRYDGILVYRPVANGMQLLKDFYYAELASPGADGRYYRIRQYTNDCKPDCARGTTTSRLYTWNGTTYV